jgi:hypothetical protein
VATFAMGRCPKPVTLTDLSMCNKKSLLDHRTDIVRPISEDRPVWRRVHD